MRPSHFCSLACLFLAIAATLPAHADDKAPYVGIWALELRHCGAEESSPDGPMLVAEDHYDRYQTHCEFKSVEAKEGDFKITADCTVQDNTQSTDFMLTVSGETLTFTDTTGARDFLRCE